MEREAQNSEQQEGLRAEQQMRRPRNKSKTTKNSAKGCRSKSNTMMRATQHTYVDDGR